MPEAKDQIQRKSKGATKGRIVVKTLFLSDIHLGTPDSKVAEVTHVVRNTICDHLVLNGDIIDGWALGRQGSKWSAAHTYFIRCILKKLEDEKVKVTYLRGNHDDILWKFLPMAFGSLEIINDYVHETPDRRYLVVHGDGFDAVTTNHKWIAMLGSVGYNALLRFNRVHAKWRRWRGLPPFSLSKLIKSKVKSAVSFVGDFEEKLMEFARQEKCDGVICGHIHTAADKHLEEIHYLNSGDWVESMTMILEHHDHRMEVVEYSDWCQRVGRRPKTDPNDFKDDDADEVEPRISS